MLSSHKILAMRIWWFATFAALIAGVLMPMFEYHKFMFFSDEHSLLTTVTGLFENKEYFIFALILIFSLIMPVYKMYVIGYVLFKENHKDYSKHYKIIDFLGKWSMLDVFVVAILVVLIKIRMIAEIEVKPGLYIFATAIVSMMILAHFVKERVAKKD